MKLTQPIEKLLLIFVSATLMGAAQLDISDPSRRSLTGMPISGKIQAADNLELGSLRVQVLDSSRRRVASDIAVGLQGHFQIPQLEVGFYELRVLGQMGEVRYSQELHSATAGFLSIQLPRSSKAGPAASVSASRLMHVTPKQARKEMEAASKAYKKGDKSLTIVHLEKAATVDPENFDAASNLGALYLEADRLELALSWLNRAQQLDPGDSVNNVNFAAYHAKLGHFDKAEAFAAKGLRYDPNSIRGHYMLAVALMKQGKDVDHAKLHLNQIEKQFAPARNLLLSLKPEQ